MIAWILKLLILCALLIGSLAAKNRGLRITSRTLFILTLLAVIVQSNWSHLINRMMPAELRPKKINYPVESVTAEQFEALAASLVSRGQSAERRENELLRKLRSREHASQFDHIQYFRKGGIRSYEGPSTCLKCHQTIQVENDKGEYRQVNLRKDLTSTTHFTFAPKNGFSTYGYNGEPVANFPLGKMDRACGVTGTFTWTGWAELIPTAKGDTLSEGCGQCHIVGQYGPISGAMMPGYSPTDAEWEATDCLICHAAEYDMNQRQVVRDRDGRMRWNQDRRFIAALSVGKPTDETCLRCHQHNLGGDTYPGNLASLQLGEEHPRILHPGAKRGTPFAPDWDVHAAAGLECLDCHVSRGHKIARGTAGVDLVANDLPGIEVSCAGCHGQTPHNKGEYADFYNDHTERIACETCHIHELYPDNLIFRDWSKPAFHEHAGIWGPSDAPYGGKPGDGIVYKWFNGYGTFMANALGDNPDENSNYFALAMNPNPLWDGSESFDYKQNYEKLFRPLARAGQSKITPFKRFQAIMYEDLNNQGPYGGMILPVDYKTYYTTGDPVAAVQAAVEKPIIRKMYGFLFKVYLMDRFMQYMGISEWNTHFSMDRIAPSPMRNEGNLMINHGIQKQGRVCSDCHDPNGILNFEALGYNAQRAAELRNIGL